MLLLLVSLVSLLLALTVLVLSINLLMRGIQTKQWQQTTSHTQSVKFKERERESSTVYKAILVYHYTVDGAEYSNDRIKMGGVSSNSYAETQAEARRSVAQYMGDSSLTVYYDPKNPENSVLETGIQWMPIIILDGFFIVFAGFGSSIFL